MYQKRHLNQGFTLLELLVVVAIIGLLTSIIVASLDSSRTKAKDSLIMSELRQFETLLGLEYSESKNYAKLQTTGGSFVTSNSGCDTAFPAPPTGSIYYAKAREICKVVIFNSPHYTDGTSWGFIADTVTNMGVPQDDKYSIMATINDSPPGIGTYFCIGMSGTSTGTSFGGKGCWSNP